MWLFLSGRIDVAAAVTAAAAMQQLQARLSGITSSAISIYEGALYLDDYDSFLNMRAAMSPPDATDVEPFRRLAAEHVSFRYPGTERLVLQDVDIEINAGEIVALVGENGSGKTTLAKLPAPLYQPTGGALKWDSATPPASIPTPSAATSPSSSRTSCSTTCSARDNIAMGRHEGFDDLDAIVAAARQAGAESSSPTSRWRGRRSWGASSPAARTCPSASGSGVALARAFFRDAPFIVLDEPTAALDARAEHQLFERIRSLTAGRAVLLISHRFSSVRRRTASTCSTRGGSRSTAPTRS